MVPERLTACVRLLAWGLALVASSRRAGADDVAPTPLERQPYRVQLAVAFEDDPVLDAALRQRALRDVGDALERYVGQLWEAEVAESDARLFRNPESLVRLHATDVNAWYADKEPDKVYLLCVSIAGSNLQVQGREWDAVTRELAPIVARDAIDRRNLPDTIVEVVRELFRPVAAVEVSKSGAASLRARGEALQPPDPGFRALVPGRRFEAYYRYLNKENLVERIQQVPWTYLEVGEVDGGTAACKVTSGLRSSLSGRRRRVQAMAVGIGPRAGSTRLTLLSRGPGHRPLSGVEVEVSPNPVARPADAPPSPDALAHLVTDRNGLVTLPATLDEDNRVVWLYVRSGQALLARVPFLIGAHTAETLELPDDSLRLETEGEIAHLQARLIDAVARRAVLMALVRTRAKERNWDEVEEQFRQVRGVARIQNFRSDLNAIRVPALKAARDRKDRTAELRITKLCDETAELIAHYLDEEKVQELREEINELREMAREEAAAAAPEAGKEDKKAAGKPRADEPAKTETPPPRPRVAF